MFPLTLQGRGEFGTAVRVAVEEGSCTGDNWEAGTNAAVEGQAATAGKAADDAPTQRRSPAANGPGDWRNLLPYWETLAQCGGRLFRVDFSMRR